VQGGGELGDREEHRFGGSTSVQEGGAISPLSLAGSAPVARLSTAARSPTAMPTQTSHGVLSSFFFLCSAVTP
jgi:hypothetical protein